MGDKLTAETTEESLGKTTALYKMPVRNEDGRVIAACEGLAYRTENKL